MAARRNPSERGTRDDLCRPVAGTGRGVERVLARIAPGGAGQRGSTCVAMNSVSSGLIGPAGWVVGSSTTW